METEQSVEKDPIEWPSAAWHLEHMRQATPAAMEGAIAYAEVRLAGLDGLTCGLAAEDLVYDAMIATRDGMIRWRPDRVTLVAHLCDRVKVMLRRMRRGAARTVQLDHMTEHDVEGRRIERELLSYEPAIERDIDVRGMARTFESALWRQAVGDQAALAFMNAVAQGADDDQSIAAMAGLPLAQVRAARRRLRRMVRTMPAALRQQARSLMS